MASRPAKRQRRSTLVRSDNDSSDAEPSLRQDSTEATNGRRKEARTNGIRPTILAKRRLRNPSANTSPKSSPEKPRKIPKKVEIANKSLHSFFGKATEEQRWKRKSATPEVDAQDFIEDDISDEEFPSKNGSRSTTATTSFSSRLKQEIPSSSQKFVKPTLPARSFTLQAPASAIVPEENQEQKPWADRYGPENLDELAVHNKKVSDVENWLRDVVAGRERKRVLVLKGPAGSGKTSTVTLLAKNLGLNTISWHNSTVSEAGMSSNMQQFGDFLNRGGGFGSLSFQDDTVSGLTPQDPAPRLLLVEEFPATSSRMSTALNAFRSALLQYMAGASQITQLGRSSLTSFPPLVMLISETLLSSSTSLNDSFTAHRLLGTEIANHPLATVIEFNPIAPTFILKALDLVVKKEARHSKRRRTPGPAVLSRLAEIGDIRSAVNSLEFLCARGDEESDWSGTVAGRPKKKEAVRLTQMEKNALQLVSQRESTLDMFHAAGKIVYNKREDPRVLDTRAEPPPKPPDHLMYLYTPKASLVDVDALMNETGTDIQTFISTLHENYVLSCNGDEFVDSLDGCSHVMSDSDILNPESRSLIRGRSNANATGNSIQSGNSDMLRQDEISFQTACRGLLFHLPFPISRAVPAGARKQDAFKMFYPASLRLWKPAEEIYDLISTFMTLSPDPSTRTSFSPQGNPSNGVSSWRSRGLGGVHDSNSFGSQEQNEDEDLPADLLRTVTSRDTQVLDVLPYTTKIRNCRQSASSQTPSQSQSQSLTQIEIQTLQILKKITQLRGMNLTTTEEPDDHDPGNDDTKPGAGPISKGGSLTFGQKLTAVHESLQVVAPLSQPQTERLLQWASSHRTNLRQTHRARIQELR